MRVVQEARAPVAKLASQKSQPHAAVSDVRHGGDDDAVLGQEGPDALEDAAGIPQMLEHVREQHCVESPFTQDLLVIERVGVADDHLVAVRAGELRRFGIDLDADDRAIEPSRQHLRHVARRASELEHARLRRDELQHEIVCRAGGGVEVRVFAAERHAATVSQWRLPLIRIPSETLSRVLRVGIDVSPLALSRAGTARYLRALLAGLQDEAVEVERYELAGEGRLRKLWRDTAWYLGTLPRAARRGGIDVLHCPTQRAPFRPGLPLVVTIHDLAVLRHPAMFNLWTRRYSALALPRIVRAASRDHRRLGVHATARSPSCWTRPRRSCA